MARTEISPRVAAMVMQRTWFSACAVGLACWLAGAPAHAGGPALEIEFNKIEQMGPDCRLTFKSTNGLAVGLDGFGAEVYLLDPRGVALQSVQFAFGAIAAAKARFAKFDLRPPAPTSCSSAAPRWRSKT